MLHGDGQGGHACLLASFYGCTRCLNHAIEMLCCMEMERRTNEHGGLACFYDCASCLNHAFEMLCCMEMDRVVLLAC